MSHNNIIISNVHIHILMLQYQYLAGPNTPIILPPHELKKHDYKGCFKHLDINSISSVVVEK